VEAGLDGRDGGRREDVGGDGVAEAEHGAGDCVAAPVARRSGERGCWCEARVDCSLFFFRKKACEECLVKDQSSVYCLVKNRSTWSLIVLSKNRVFL
jgi:hypothetical protein